MQLVQHDQLEALEEAEREQVHADDAGRDHGARDGLALPAHQPERRGDEREPRILPKIHLDLVEARVPLIAHAGKRMP
jgi:hypothetical protein